ncbi:MAG TPA: nitrite reductase large subunit NirB [Steroidobacteraceae bacterium]|nr:nitrite reductase large subunit NirB [Steroidobacteraceae bacterium]
MNARCRVLVIGNGMVGQRFLESLAADAPCSLTVLAEEPRPAYDRVQLSSFFSGKTADDLSLVDAGFFEKNGIALNLSERAIAIDREQRRVRTSRGRELDYDILVMATGSYPFVPAVTGRDRPHCHVYRTIEDLEAIRASSEGARAGAVIGGGLLGLEAAKALRDLGVETHVVEFAPRLMALQVDDGGGNMLRRKIEALGVHVHTGKNTREIIAGTDQRHRMSFADGGSLEVDLIVFSAGIRPRDELARAAGLSVGERGGIVIDDTCRTSDQSIYAIGECALWRGKVFGLVSPGYQMAQVAAAHIAGSVAARQPATLQAADSEPVASPREAAFTGADMSTKLKLLGVDVASIGDAHAAAPGTRTYSFIDERRQIYKKLVVNEAGTRVLGGVLVGNTDDYGSWLQMMLNELPLPEHPEDLILAPRADAPAAHGTTALPATAQICSCNNVSKGAICAAVEAGCTTIGALKKHTRAASSCGGCAPLVTQILKAELQRKGMAVDNHLCEHFRYSRQQLFSLIRVGGLRTFEATLQKHGRGLGCDICKPAIGSILASCWNEFVLAGERASLQDTNDYFLANMQKDGTYSVVPRVPGGEITPDKLIVLGQVAKHYGLYTKITGGQRIDLFGARVHQLPQIWADLIAGGFESGHAYGKAMRTVKSCVGSTWCRYGVQDSVGLAIQIENRYRGLRAPHKIKLAVSGCTRECAEAQGKDVGVIASEKGWNLYVCGNGGMKPRHAELLAADLDKETLIRYIDRFLMFYIRTADRLQRTSTWRDNLEGGLEYLQQVVCEDKLGIAAELEADMARIVATYECEWKKAIEDPVTLRRFRHFINSDAADGHVVFVEERGQIRPATREERRKRTEVLA